MIFTDEQIKMYLSTLPDEWSEFEKAKAVSIWTSSVIQPEIHRLKHEIDNLKQNISLFRSFLEVEGYDVENFGRKGPRKVNRC